MLHKNSTKKTQNSLELRQQLALLLLQETHRNGGCSRLLAKEIGVSVRTVQNWLQGNCFPNGVELLKLMSHSRRLRKGILAMSNVACFDETDLLQLKSEISQIIDEKMAR